MYGCMKLRGGSATLGNICSALIAYAGVANIGYASSPLHSTYIDYGWSIAGGLVHKSLCLYFVSVVTPKCNKYKNSLGGVFNAGKAQSLPLKMRCRK